MKSYTLTELCKPLSQMYTIEGAHNAVCVSGIASPQSATENALIFILRDHPKHSTLLAETRAKIIIGDPSLERAQFQDKTFILVADPKLAFVEITKTLFTSPRVKGIHPTAIIHPEATVDPSVTIGPYTVIKRAKINANTVIASHCLIEDDVAIAEDVIIQAGAKIGTSGCGHVRGTDNHYLQFPQIGGVRIKRGVHIGSNSCIARGALSDTIVGAQTVIDSFVQIGHNVVIENDVMILANTVIAGSSIIGEHTVIAIGAHIGDYVNVGSRAHIGPGAIVIEDVPSGAKIMARTPFIINPNVYK